MKRDSNVLRFRFSLCDKQYSKIQVCNKKFHRVFFPPIKTMTLQPLQKGYEGGPPPQTTPFLWCRNCWGFVLRHRSLGNTFVTILSLLLFYLIVNVR